MVLTPTRTLPVQDLLAILTLVRMLERRGRLARRFVLVPFLAPHHKLSDGQKV